MGRVLRVLRNRRNGSDDGAYDRAPLRLCDADARQARGRGAGRALIEELVARAERAGWGRLYWMTRENNVVARKLYDSVAEREDFVRYTIAFGDAPRD